MTRYPRTAVFVLVVAVALTGCVGTMSYPTFEPISYKPSSMGPAEAIPVDSLTPTFSWRQRAEDVMARMDLAVWQVGPNGSPGEQFYFAQGIIGNQHQITKPLVAGTEYFWSIKRSDSSVWATANYVGVSPLGAAWQNGVPFKIKAPAVIAAPVQVAPPIVRADVPAPAMSPSQIPASSSPYAPFARQIGGIWFCQLPANKDGTPMHEEAVFAWSDNREGIHVDLWAFKGDTRVSHTTELVVWNGSERNFLLTGTDTEGNLKQSVITMEGDVQVSDLKFTKKDGTIIMLHGRTRFLSDDATVSEIFQSRSGAWVKLQDLVFERRRT